MADHSAPGIDARGTGGSPAPRVGDRPVLVGLVGQGIGPSRTPRMHMDEGRAQGVSLDYRLIDMAGREEPLGDLLSRLEGEGFDGLNVTYPYKRAVAAHLHELSDNARAGGAVNTAAVVARHGAGRAEAASDPSCAAQADGIVNATPVGMEKLPGLPIPPEALAPRHWVADVVYFPLETALLRAARAKGCRVLPGSGMAIFQAVRAFGLFTGLTADPARMRATFEAFDAPAEGSA